MDAVCAHDGSLCHDCVCVSTVPMSPGICAGIHFDCPDGAADAIDFLVSDVSSVACDSIDPIPGSRSMSVRLVCAPSTLT